MKSKYWTMNSEVGCTMSQSLSKKISQNFNGIKYECECGKTHGVIHDIVNSTDVLYIKCDKCVFIYFDEEQMNRLNEDSIIKLSNVCDYRNSENSPNFDKMQRIMHETMHERYGVRATPEQPTIKFTEDATCNSSSDDKDQEHLFRRPYYISKDFVYGAFISRHSTYGIFPNDDNRYKELKMKVSSIYGEIKNKNNDKK